MNTINDQNVSTISESGSSSSNNQDAADDINNNTANNSATGTSTTSTNRNNGKQSKRNEATSRQTAEDSQQSATSIPTSTTTSTSAKSISSTLSTSTGKQTSELYPNTMKIELVADPNAPELAPMVRITAPPGEIVKTSTTSLTNGEYKFGEQQTTTSTLLNQAETCSLTSQISETDLRGEWSTKLDFMMSCVGYAVGLGNLWRFPYLCYKNGGGSFLIPYFFCLFVSGIPVFLLETTLGQMLGQGVISIWNICPIMKGLGYSTVIITFWMNCYYIVVVSWSLYYAYQSVNFDVPWRSCNQTWNTPMCMSNKELKKICTDQLGNLTDEIDDRDRMTSCVASIEHTDSVIEFWERKVLNISSGIDSTGSLHWQLAICLFLIWAFCYFTIHKGVKWSGKIIYFTALFPYFCMSILFVRGITLDGAFIGLKYYFTPKMDKLLDANVWNDAATQIFFSYGLGLGAWIALSSYNKFHNNVLKDTLIICLINAMTALFSGAIVFSILGFMAKTKNQSMESTSISGAGLTFIVYPEATLNLPLSPLWAVLFFTMLIVLGLGSQFVQLESFFTAIIDEFPEILRKRRKLFVFYIMVISSLIGLIFVTESGIYWFELFNFYSASGFALLYIIFFEVVIVFWFYGSEKYISKIEYMLGQKISMYWIVCLKYITPCTCLLIFFFSLVQHKPIKYQNYDYPKWGVMFGWFLALSSMICVPAYALFRLSTISGTFKERWNLLCTANEDEINNTIQKRSNKNRIDQIKLEK